MTKNNVKEILGQLIMPRLEIAKYRADRHYRSFTNNLIEQNMVVGFCIFGGTIESLPIILSELQALAKKAGAPELLMSCDCEWGLPMRLHSGGTEFPHLMALQQMNDLKGIERVAQSIGNEMSSLGLHWNFAPVADVNSNPKNPIINIRSFSGDPNSVAECAKSFYHGLENAGIISTAKHFPGHGDTHIDSHRDLPSIDKSAEEFDVLELVPFKYLSQQGIPAIMTGHIAAPKLAGKFGAKASYKKLPATISSFLTKKLLREHIGFTGIIITDSLEMFALQKIISNPGEIASRAFLAGADILLMPTDPVAAFEGLEQALEQGRISYEQVEQSIVRIQKLRSKYILNNSVKISVQWLDHQNIARNAAKNSMMLTGTIAKPLSPSSVIIIASGAESEKQQAEYIARFFSSEFPEIPFQLIISDEITEIDLGSNPLIITLYRPRGALTEDVNRGSIYSDVSEIVRKLKIKKIHPFGVISLGDPYIAEEFIGTEPNFILRTYSDSHPSIKMALQLLKEYI